MILVDTQKTDLRSGYEQGTVDQVLVIDHHTPPKSPPDNWRFQCETLGAATTLTHRNTLDPPDPHLSHRSHLMLAGIYEDTGGLTYASTTPRDMRAAAWLVDQGANLELAIEFLDHPLSETQLAIYQRAPRESGDVGGGRHPIVMSWAARRAGAMRRCLDTGPQTQQSAGAQRALHLCSDRWKYPDGRPKRHERHQCRGGSSHFGGVTGTTAERSRSHPRPPRLKRSARNCAISCLVTSNRASKFAT